jgi:hypothetical protein
MPRGNAPTPTQATKRLADLPGCSRPKPEEKLCNASDDFNFTTVTAVSILFGFTVVAVAANEIEAEHDDREQDPRNPGDKQQPPFVSQETEW